MIGFYYENLNLGSQCSVLKRARRAHELSILTTNIAHSIKHS